MASTNDIPALSDASLLAEQEQAHKLEYQLVVTIACHMVWGITRFVFDLTKMGAVHPHILATTIGALGYFVAQLSKTDGELANLRQEISSRGLDRRQLK